MKYESKIQKRNLLIQLLKSKPRSMKELTERLEVDKRTVHRYIRELREIYGFDIKYDRNNKVYRIETVEEIDSGSLFLKPQEIESLDLAFRFLKKRRNFPLINELGNVIKKIKEWFPAPESLSIGMTDYSIPSSIKKEYYIIKDAIKDRTYIKFKYFGSKEGKDIERVVVPWHVIFAKGKWYLIGYCKIRNELRIFNIKKMKELVKTNKSISLSETPMPRKIVQFRKDMFGPWKGKRSRWVQIYYKKEAARYIREMKFYQDYEIKEIGNGDLRLKIKVSYPEAVLFYLVLPYHYYAEVEKPKSLRKKMVKYIEKMLEMYK